MREAPRTAARVVELLGGVWSWAEKRGYVSGLSPVKGVEKHRSSPRDRTLDNEELGHLGAVLRENAGTAANAVRLIAVTGLRQGEATGLKWSEVDDACLRLEATKTGRSTRPIGRAASEFLASLPRHGELVFPIPSPPKSRSRPCSTWQDYPMHAHMRYGGRTPAQRPWAMATIAELLGHARRGVTERHYVRRPDAMLIEAASKTADTIDQALGSDFRYKIEENWKKNE